MSLHPVSTASSDPYRIRRLTLRFRDPRIEREYAAAFAEGSLRQVRTFAIALFGVWALVVGLFYALLWTRSGIHPPPAVLAFGAAAAVFAAATRWRHTALVLRPLTLLLFALCAVLFAHLNLRGNAVAQDIETTFQAQIFSMALMPPAFTVARLGFLYGNAASILLAGGWFASTLATGRYPLLGALYYFGIVAGVYAMSAATGYVLESLFRREFVASRLLEAERQRSERLLLNVLPAAIAARLKERAGTIADSHPAATVLFADVVGFTQLSASLTAEALVERLDRVFSTFDALTESRGLEKIKTIGDAYMVVGGLPEARSDHATAVANLALDMLRAIEAAGDGLHIRIGIHTGPVVAGVIGTSKFTYDLWGDTVNTAARMESHGIPGQIHVTEAAYHLLRDSFTLEPRGEIDVKGKGPMRTYLLLGPRTAADVASDRGGAAGAQLHGPCAPTPQATAPGSGAQTPVGIPR